jgi:Zn-dependent M28 family amino/carboxypeptidase
VRRIRNAAAVSFATLTASALLGAAVTPALAAPPAEPAGKGPAQADNRNNNTSEKLRQSASAQSALQHLQVFQAFASDNEDTRASGTQGYDSSADYVVAKLRAAGYAPEVQEFDFAFFQQLSEPVLTVGGEDIDTATATYSGAGAATGTVIPVDLVLDPPRGNDSGCQAADFAGIDLSGDNDVVLVQRGTCAFGQKAANAEAAGAEAVVIMNQGNGTPESNPDRYDLFFATLGDPGITIPVVTVSFDDGVRLVESASAGDLVTVATDTISEVRTTTNVFAQTSGRTDNVVMVGAHLDSVTAGPGINDNASGSAGILEVAEKLAKFKPDNAVRFAWWGAEELGLLGSWHYIEDLYENNPQELENIALYLNFDMIASPNFARLIYDGDGSAGLPGGPGPEGSAAIEDLFTDFFTTLGLNSQETDFSGRSDYGPFIAVGIPAGGLFTGAEGIKTPRQAQLFGGVAGIAYDECYHLACDDITNISMEAFEQNIDAIAHAVIVYGYSTESVNGVEGADAGDKTTVTGPGGGISGGDGDGAGGGLHPGHGHGHGHGHDGHEDDPDDRDAF